MSYNLDLVILKTLLSNKKYALDFANEQDAKLFSPEVWNFANILLSYLKTYKELPTLRVLSERAGKNDKIVENIQKIWDAALAQEYDEKEFPHDLERLQKRFANKQLSSLKEKLSSFSDDAPIDKSIMEITKSLKQIESTGKSSLYTSKSVKEYLGTFVEQFKAKRANPELEQGVLTGYSFLDYATNGIREADMLLIAGESGFGKSLFLNNIAVQTWLQKNSVEDTEFKPGKSVIYFSLEMPYEDCFNRFLGRLAGVETRHLEKPGLVSRDEFIRIKRALDFIDRYPNVFKIVDISDACANDLEAILDDAAEDFDTIFIDYLGIMKSNKDTDEQDWLKQGKIAYEVRAIARRKQRPIFSAVQLNRKSPGKEGAESIGLSRLARSGTIATHATHVIQIENRPNEELHNDFLYHIIKNRKGPKGKGILIKNLPCGTLIDQRLDNEKFESDFTEYLPDISELEDIDL